MSGLDLFIGMIVSQWVGIMKEPLDDGKQQLIGAMFLAFEYMAKTRCDFDVLNKLALTRSNDKSCLSEKVLPRDHQLTMTRRHL